MAAIEQVMPPSMALKRKRGEGRTAMNKRPRFPSPSFSSSSGSDNSDDDSDDAATPMTPVTPRSRSPSSNPKQRPLKYFCDYNDCGKGFSRPVRLAEHKRSHTNDRIFKCSHPPCEKDFLRESHLKAHVKNTHTNIRDHACDWEGCDKAFSTGTRLRRHRAAHEKPKKNEFHCTGFPPCNELFRKQGTLQRHVDFVHLQTRSLRCPHTDVATGRPCQSSFDKPISLRTHEAQYHGETRFSCTICHRDPLFASNFATYNELQAHIRLEHPPYCEFCGLVCSTNAQVRDHIDITHNDTTVDSRRKLPCTYEGCEKTFAKQFNLNVHVKTQHENQKRFKCGETDVSASAGLEHWDAANACGQPFTTKQSLAIHVRRHHLPDSKPKSARKKAKKAKSTVMDKLTGGSKRIACVVFGCGDRFLDQAAVEDHAMRAHGMTPAEVTEALAEKGARNGGKFWIGGSEDEDDEEPDYTGLGPEANAVEVGDFSGVGGGLPFSYGSASDRQNEAELACMLSSFVNNDGMEDKQQDVRIDPALREV